MMGLRIHHRAKALLGGVAAVLLLAGLVGATPAFATAPYWQLSSSPAPTNLAPGGTGKIVVTASNQGDGVTSGEITISDKLPAGLTATAISGSLAYQTGEALECSLATLSCTDKTKPLQPSTGLKVAITVSVSAANGSTLANEVKATGGGAPSASVTQPVRVSSEPAPFGVEKYEFRPEEESGAPDLRAGSHPFQLTTTFAMNQNAAEEPVGLPRDLQFNLPAGLLGNPTSLPQCNQVDFTTILPGPANLCAPETAIGVAEVTIDEPAVFQSGPETVTVPVFNLEPAPGEPARFGIVALKVPVVLSTAVRTGSDYGVVVTAKSTDQAAGLVSSKVTIWGVPGDHRHDAIRGWECAESGSFGHSLQSCKQQQENRAEHEATEKEKGEGPKEPKPFLVLPTSCSTPWEAPMHARSWAPGATFIPEGKGLESEYPVSLGACDMLTSFSPAIAVEPESHAASTPTGMAVRVTMPQPETDEGLAESAVRSTTVTLPEGLQLNPGAANGLEACSALQMGFNGAPEATQTNNDQFSPDEALCEQQAKGSKVGTATIVSPDLKESLTGSVYLAGEGTNPFEPPLVLYVVAFGKESGVRVKLAGKVTPDPVTGQLVSTFENTPQVPFKELTLQFFGGGRASQSTPPLCGPYTTSSSFVPWSGNAAAAPTSSFNIESGPGGGPCSGNPQVFAPGFGAGSSNLQGGAFTPFTLTIQRPDGQQALSSLSTRLPPGMAAMLSSVTPCPIAQADAAQCGPASLIGHATTLTGLGSQPFTLGGSVYLTGPFAGAPFGISVATPAVAGPFNLGMVIANSTIQVDQNTAAVTVTTVESRILDPRGSTAIASSPLPTIIKGVPVQLKEINVSVDRPNFQFNPTNCNPLAITGALSGSQGAVAPVSSRFQVANCGSLPFGPKLTASVAAQASKANGAGFNVNVESKGFGQANIAKVELQLPESLPSRLTTIQKACADAIFNANPATCNEGSLIGKATIHTPVLKNPLTGPAYLVSHGNAAFPDVEFVLQGEGITLILDGKTDIKKGITYSRFEAAPDAPFTTFVTELPAGPHSALAAYVPASKNYNLCGASLAMPTVITAQNGAVIRQTTQILPTPCGAVKAFKATRAQLLAKALKACKQKYKKNKHKRVACEKAAKKKYGAKKHAKAKAKKKK